jgi:hypothetical protein
MKIRLISTPYVGLPPFGAPHDRGCVSCGFIFDSQHDELTPAESTLDLVVDARKRYWCLGCVAQALAHVQRRNDERTDYHYPWNFEATGGVNGQHISTTHFDQLAEMTASLEAKASAMPLLEVEISQELVEKLLRDDG